MLRVIKLINQKNHYLEKFYSLNETELLNFAEGNFGNLDYFYETRESILATLKHLDAEIEKAQFEDSQLTTEHKRAVSTALAIKDEYVARILAQDLEILSCIENAKSSIIRELQDLRKAKKAVGSYKSRTFNKRLDEEA